MSRFLILICILFVLCFSEQTSAHESCTVQHTGEPGKCIKFKDCPQVLAEHMGTNHFGRARRITICDKHKRTLCCPLPPDFIIMENNSLDEVYGYQLLD
ncbi:unnamed protein product [Diamesa hyperborea]